jgi:hypothetical protein
VDALAVAFGLLLRAGFGSLLRRRLVSIDNERLPPIERLLEAVDYNPETGKLYWRPRLPATCTDDAIRTRFNRQWAGREVGSHNGDGYLNFRILDCTITAHRAAWALFYGEWPSDQIDHINGQRDDNTIANLRVVDTKENSQNRAMPANNKSGTVGVHYCSTAKKWLAKIQGRRIGSYDDYASAVQARKEAAALAGFHPNHGRARSRRSK